MNNNTIKNVLWMCLGSFLAGCGIAIALSSGLGADPITVFFEGLSKSFHITVGMASNITILTMALCAFVIDRKQVGLGTVITPFFTAWGIDLTMHWSPQFTSFPLNYLQMFGALIICAFGIAMVIAAHMGNQGTDALILALSEKTQKPYHYIRWFTDGALLVGGILLGGSLTPATLIAVLVLGKMVSFFRVKVFRDTVTIH